MANISQYLSSRDIHPGLYWNLYIPWKRFMNTRFGPIHVIPLLLLSLLSIYPPPPFHPPFHPLQRPWIRLIPSCTRPPLPHDNDQRLIDFPHNKGSVCPIPGNHKTLNCSGSPFSRICLSDWPPSMWNVVLSHSVICQQLWNKHFPWKPKQNRESVTALDSVISVPHFASQSCRVVCLWHITWQLALFAWVEAEEDI